MKKTYITQMPDKAGAFLEASRIISSVGANITRVSYNKAVDMHLLFIEVSADENEQEYISKKLNKIGYILNENSYSKIILVEFRMRDVPGALLPVLELINSFNFNISYMSSQESYTGFQSFKMGIFINNPDTVKQFLDAAANLCEIKIIDYDKSQKILDNTVFYLSFANQVASKLLLDKDATNKLITDSNLIMQILDEKNESPYKTFSYIGKFADMLNSFKGSSFNAKITRKALKNGLNFFVIEPPCGSNTYILEKENSLMFIDCGFACYQDEMLLTLYSLFPNFDSMEKSIIITHPDIDHCGLLYLFKKVFVSEISYKNFKLENSNKPNYREQNDLHAPYCRISKILSNYVAPSMNTLHLIGNKTKDIDSSPIRYIDSINFCGVELNVYEGNGGHANGEVVIVSQENKLVFSGDIIVNINGFSKEQKEFNTLAPYLMTSVNMDSQLAKIERNYLLSQFNPDNYTYCCGHGSIINEKNIL